jgi:hypothetical protein
MGFQPMFGGGISTLPNMAETAMLHGGGTAPPFKNHMC